MSIHPSAEVSSAALLGTGVRVWHQAQIREGATIGPGSIVGKGVYIGAGVSVGANCKLQNYSCVYEGCTLEDGVFIGPAVILTNDRYPRAINPDGSMKQASDWECAGSTIGRGASLGARSVVLPGVAIGEWALIAAGSTVTRDVPAHALCIGAPAVQRGWVCVCARRLGPDLRCPFCGRTYERAASGLAIVGN